MSNSQQKPKLRPLRLIAVIMLVFLLIGLCIFTGDVSVKLRNGNEGGTTDPNLQKMDTLIGANGTQIFLAPATYVGGATAIKRDIEKLCARTISETGNHAMPGIVLQSITQVVADQKSATNLLNGNASASQWLLKDSLSALAPYLPGGVGNCTFSSITMGLVLPFRDKAQPPETLAATMIRLSSLAVDELKNWSSKSNVSLKDVNWYASAELPLSDLDKEATYKYWDSFYSEYIGILPTFHKRTIFMMAPFTGRKLSDITQSELQNLTRNAKLMFGDINAAILARGGSQLRISISDRTGTSACNDDPHTPSDAAAWVTEIRQITPTSVTGINMELFRRSPVAETCSRNEPIARSSMLSRLMEYQKLAVPVLSVYELRYLVDAMP